MRVLSVRGRWIAALGLLAAGSAYAGHLAISPPAAKAADTSSIRLLTERLRSNSAPTLPTLGTAVVARPRVGVTPEEANSTQDEKPSPARQTAQSSSSSDGALSVPSGASAADAGVKNIALMGVTNSDGEDQAWLVNLDNQEREVVDEGGAAWGFTVKDIEEETIVLARGAEQFTLRMGEKEIPVQEAPAPTPAVSETGRRGNWGGGGDRGGRRDRIRQWMASQANGGNRGSGRSWGGGNWRGSSNSSSSSNDSRSGRGNRGSGGRSFSGGGFNPGAMSWAMGRGGGRGSQTQNAGPTSNPQTARRRGGQLIGGADPIEAPDSITNPQTTRRLGTNSSTAFGEQSNSRGRNQGGDRRR